MGAPLLGLPKYIYYVVRSALQYCLSFIIFTLIRSLVGSYISSIFVCGPLLLVVQNISSDNGIEIPEERGHSRLKNTTGDGHGNPQT